MIYISLLLMLIAGSFNGVMDTLAHHHSISIFKNRSPYSFFGKQSWVRKYKENNYELGPRFLGSTTFLVFLTDGWHLFQFLMKLAIVGSVVTYNPIWYMGTWVPIDIASLLAIVGYYGFWGMGFTLMYGKVLLKR